MAVIVGIILLLAFIGIGMRISKATHISFVYVVICIVCWSFGVIFFLVNNQSIMGYGKLLDIGMIIVFPIVLIFLGKGIIQFLKWAIGGIAS